MTIPITSSSSPKVSSSSSLLLVDALSKIQHVLLTNGILHHRPTTTTQHLPIVGGTINDDNNDTMILTEISQLLYALFTFHHEEDEEDRHDSTLTTTSTTNDDTEPPIDQPQSQQQQIYHHNHPILLGGITLESCQNAIREQFRSSSFTTVTKCTPKTTSSSSVELVVVREEDDEDPWNHPYPQNNNTSPQSTRSTATNSATTTTRYPHIELLSMVMIPWTAPTISNNKNTLSSSSSSTMSSSAVVVQSSSNIVQRPLLLQLPIPFSRALLQVLIESLSNTTFYTVSQWACLFSSTLLPRDRDRKPQQQHIHSVSTTTSITSSSGVALSILLDIYESLLLLIIGDQHPKEEEEVETPEWYQLVQPLSQLLGIVATAGIDTYQYHRIRTMIITGMAHHYRTNPIPLWIRLTLIQALTMATGGGGGMEIGTNRSSSSSALSLLHSSSTSSVNGNASSTWNSQSKLRFSATLKEYYFCFTGRPNATTSHNSNNNMNTNTASGLHRTINGLSNWPFRNDFGMAVWFRMEPLPWDPHHHSPVPPPTTLLSIRTENGGGLVISIIPIESVVSTKSSTTTNTMASTTPDAYTIAISIYDSNTGTTTIDPHTAPTPSQTIVTSRNGIVLLPQIWYHIAVRHTRSRMKGVFSLSSREQVSIFLDGKCMCTESLPFPNITDTLYTSSTNYLPPNITNSTDGKPSILKLRRNPNTRPHSSMNLTISFATNFVGQTGALYIFNDPVSDATLRALYEITGGVTTTGGAATNSGSGSGGGSSSSNLNSTNNMSGTDKNLKRNISTKQHAIVDTWDARRSDMVRKSRLIDFNMKPDDAEELVLSQRRTSMYHKQRMINKMIRVLDLAESDDYHTNDMDMQEYPIHLQKSAFGSKIFLTWDPQRTLRNTLALELRIGAHVNMNEDVCMWGYHSAKDVINSVGGIQSLLPLMHSLLSCDMESDDFIAGDKDAVPEPRPDVMAAIPNLIRLVISFIQGHNDNARELLRCGGIDILEQMLLNCKKLATTKKSASSLFGSINIHPQVAQKLVDALLDLRSSCSHYVSLETKVYSRLLFNIPLWFSGFSQLPGAALHTEFLPVLASLTRLNPEKVRDCVGVKNMIVVLKEYFVTPTNEIAGIDDGIDRYSNTETASSFLCHSLSIVERRQASRILLGMIFTVLSTGTTMQSFAPFLNLISHTLDSSFGTMVDHISKSKRTPTDHTGDRMLAIDACMVLFLLLQLRPMVDGLYESFAQACGGVQGGASWILMALVNVPDDEIRSIGIRCISTYLDVTNRGADMPLSLGTIVKPMAVNPDTHNDVSATVRRASTRITEIAKGLATGTQSYRPIVLQPSRLTARVVYKLLWHLLKSHRLNLGDFTEASLFHWITNDDDSSSSCCNIDFVLSHMNSSWEGRMPALSFNYSWCTSIICEESNFSGKLLHNPLAIGTVLRLLRFLSDDRKDKWLPIFLNLTKSSRKCVSTLASLPEWQPCLFQLISESLEMVGSCKLSLVTDTSDDTFNASEEQVTSQKRLDLYLQLYSTLLGHLLRSGGDKSLEAVERLAALQRMAVNGNHVLIMVLSHLCGDVFENGTLLDVGSITAQDWQELDLDFESLLLKQSAKLVADAILSKGTKGLDLTVAVRSWRALRHLTEVVVAVVTRCSLGVVDLFDYINYQASSIDSISGGLHGIRPADRYVKGITAAEYALILNSHLLEYTDKNTALDMDRRLCVTLSAQVLTLLDSFIFPESLNSAGPTTQLDGLALVRFSEARLGSSQGPLISSAIRLSILLLALLEPCSVTFLQCASRLRCLLCWALELLREHSSPDGQHQNFHSEGEAHIDRLILAVTLHCHRALGRCSALLWEIESTTSEKYFHSKDAHKKFYRRLLRVALELRDVVSTAFRGRNEILRVTMSTEAYEALRLSLEGDALSEKLSKESVVREFLSSPWVTGFADTVNRQDLAIPEQVSMETIPLSSDQALNPYSQGFYALEKLALESKNIVSDFESAINSCFEEYLQAQRTWAETDAVRDLEYDGDTTSKRLTENYKFDSIDATKLANLRRAFADGRWRAIESKVSEPWSNAKHWKLARYTDMRGRRTLMVPNRDFNDHAAASYDLAVGKEQEKEELERQKRLLAKKDLSDVMRRNAAAFIVDDGHSVTSQDDGSSQLRSDGDSTAELESSTDGDSCGNADTMLQEILIHDTLPNDEQDEEWDKVDTEEIIDVDIDGGTDSWAKAFVWADGESVIARFEPVMIVSLQSFVEGKILLTTHGLYFHQLGDEINAITKEPMKGSEATEVDTKDRRWRLARLTEVHGRRFMLRSQALELFFSDNNELLLNFSGGVKDRDRFHAKLRHSCKVPMLWSLKSLSPRVIFQKSKFAELWKKRKISNFDYLMALNRMAGRSFNDLTQYPVFPWILSDYTSDSIDLNDSRIYRDLSKPIGALNSDRLEQLLDRYSELELFGFTEAEKFLYGSHYSSPGIVLHYLIRQEPFTSMAIDLQSGRFDCADRLFFDMSETWKSCLTSTSDVKELIPEFFCTPEIFLNTNQFPLGRTQTGKVIGDVTLPLWAKGSAHEFVRMHRLALESDYVSENLHHWVDLIFGYKQRGTEAFASHNIFHHLSYEGSVDLSKICDEIDRNAAESHIQNFGQTPSQLITEEPHPQRYSSEHCWKPLLTVGSSEKNFRCYSPSNQFPNQRGEYAKGPVLQVHVFSDSVIAVYADLTLGTYKWNPTSKTNRLRADKIRPLIRRDWSTSRFAMKRGSAVSPELMDRSCYAMGNWSVGITLGGLAKEILRRNALLSSSSRLISGHEMSLSTAEASAIIVSCSYWDESLKAHSVDGSRIMASESGGHRGPIRCLALGGPDNGTALMVTGGQDGTVRIWVVDHPDMSTALSDGYVQTALGGGGSTENDILRCCHCLWGHVTPVVSVALDSNTDIVVSGSEMGLVCIHTLRRGEFIRSFHPPPVVVGGITSHNNNNNGDDNNNNNNVSAGLVHKIAVGTEGTMVLQMADMGLHTYTVNAVRLCTVNANEIIHDMKFCSMDEIIITGGDRCQVLFRHVNDLPLIITYIDLSRHGPIRCLTLSTPQDWTYPTMDPHHYTPPSSLTQCLFIGSDDGMITVIDEDPVHFRNEDSNVTF